MCGFKFGLSGDNLTVSRGQVWASISADRLQAAEVRFFACLAGSV